MWANWKQVPHHDYVCDSEDEGRRCRKDGLLDGWQVVG